MMWNEDYHPFSYDLGERFFSYELVLANQKSQLMTCMKYMKKEEEAEEDTLYISYIKLYMIFFLIWRKRHRQRDKNTDPDRQQLKNMVCPSEVLSIVSLNFMSLEKTPRKK